MKFPFVVLENLSEEQMKKWKNFYAETETHNPRTEEGIWRRTQEKQNKDESGWKNPNDCRRRMLHYFHCFDIQENKHHKFDLVLKESYLWINLSLLSSEIDELESCMLESAQNGWKIDFVDNINCKKHLQFVNEDLRIDVKIYKQHPADLAEGRLFPKEYNSMDITVYSEWIALDDDFKNKPWYILKTGFRQKLKKQKPITGNIIEKIIDLFPAQIELGCGPSIEAGVPPLKYLHEVYCVTDQIKKKAIFRYPDDHLIFDIIENPKEAYRIMTNMQKKCFLAEPTKFHEIIKELHKKGMIVGPVITNNFDGLIRKAGLEEYYVRKYESENIIPKINFHDNAKSLIVVGSHADRRKIHQAARKKGLVVVYIDPEGYYEKGKFEAYPLEAPQICDLVYNEFATKAFEEIYKKILNK